MSAIEMKEAITRLIDTDNEDYLAEILDYAKSVKGDGELLPHETPEFLAELMQIDSDMESGKEPTYTREEMDAILDKRRGF